MKATRIWFGLYVVSQLLDILLTYIGLQRGFEEGNATAARLFISIGFIPTALLMKGTSILLGSVLYFTKQVYLLAIITLWITWIALIPWCYAIFVLGGPQ